MNYNINTDVNETEFEDLKQYGEITEPQQIIDALGDVVILNRFKHNIEYLLNKTVDIAVLCWGNKDEHGVPLQHTLIKFKVDLDDTVVRSLPLNRFMLSLIFIRPVIEYIDNISIDDFILHDMDAVVLANYANEHAPFAIRAMRLGKHVRLLRG